MKFGEHNDLEIEDRPDEDGNIVIGSVQTTLPIEIINKADAIKIINHLKQVFGIEG